MQPGWMSDQTKACQEREKGAIAANERKGRIQCRTALSSLFSVSSLRYKLIGRCYVAQRDGEKSQKWNRLNGVGINME